MGDTSCPVSVWLCNTWPTPSRWTDRRTNRRFLASVGRSSDNLKHNINHRLTHSLSQPIGWFLPADDCLMSSVGLVWARSVTCLKYLRFHSKKNLNHCQNNLTFIDNNLVLRHILFPGLLNVFGIVLVSWQGHTLWPNNIKIIYLLLTITRY